MERYNLERVTVEHPDGPLTFQLIVNDRTRTAVKVQSVGWWGRLNTNDLQPFVILNDGRLDFGALPDDDFEHHKTGRFGESKIFEARIKVDEFVRLALWDDDGRLVEKQFRISGVQEILGSGPAAQFQV